MAVAIPVAKTAQPSSAMVNASASIPSGFKADQADPANARSAAAEPPDTKKHVFSALVPASHPDLTISMFH